VAVGVFRKNKKKKDKKEKQRRESWSTKEKMKQ
jgi:hypothetical protein